MNKPNDVDAAPVHAVVIAYYSEPSSERPCSLCKFRQYDSWHNESWCQHTPPPLGIGERLLIDTWGTCEHWEESR